jgi:hypothetical protein
MAKQGFLDCIKASKKIDEVGTYSDSNRKQNIGMRGENIDKANTGDR